jgi:hypothetical protein
MSHRSLYIAGLSRAASRVPGLRYLPIARVLAFGQLALVAREHLQNLDTNERRRLLELVRKGRATSPGERDELRTLVGKLDAWAFAGAAAGNLSPVPLPRRLTERRR